MPFHILGSVFLGWSLGSNDAANVFGTAVASRMVRFRVAVVLICIFVVIGAVVQGGPGIKRVGGLTEQTPISACITCVTAALTVAIMTFLRLPVSATQGLAGAVIGMGLYINPAKVQWGTFSKMVACWVGTPIGAAIIAMILYPLLAKLLNSMRLGLVGRSIVLKIAMIIGGSYGAYALGANSVANVTGVFYKAGAESFRGDILLLALIGAGSIALGVPFSRKVMFTVGSKLVALDSFSALVAMLAQAVTVHMYAFVHIPVSTSQAIVGAVLGIGLYKGVKTINRGTLGRIVFAWVCTPAIAGAAAFAAAMIFL